MARYYFEREHAANTQPGVWAIHDRSTNERVGALHDVVLAERVVGLLNQYEEKFDGR